MCHACSTRAVRRDEVTSIRESHRALHTAHSSSLDPSSLSQYYTQAYKHRNERREAVRTVFMYSRVSVAPKFSRSWHNVRPSSLRNGVSAVAYRGDVAIVARVITVFGI